MAPMAPQPSYRQAKAPGEGRLTAGRRARLLVVLLTASLAACGGDRRKDVLDVYAAASLRDALKEIHEVYRRDHGVKVNMNNGSSGMLSVQIEQGGNCDVFLSAGAKEMNRLVELGLVDRESRAMLLSNELVMIVPSGEGAGISEPADLASDDVRLVSIANPNGVPAGRYARTWLRDIGLWDRVEDRVLPATNVRSALAAVESGGAEVGVVYRTDAAISAKVDVVYAVPIAQGPRIHYPVAAMLDRPRSEQSRAYIAYLQSDEVLQIFRHHGFLIHEEG